MVVIQAKKDRAFKKLTTHVLDVYNLTPRVKGIDLSLDDSLLFKFKAGQFVQVVIPGKDGTEQRKSYSIASSPYMDNKIELCVTKVDGGVSSEYLHSLKSGDRVTFIGPFGKLTLPNTVTTDLVFIAVGSGVAPIRSIIKTLYRENFSKRVYFLFGNRSEVDIIYKQEWDQLSKDWPNFKALYVLSRPSPNWAGKKGYVQDVLEEFIPDLKNKEFYVCGLNKMITSIEDKLLRLEVPRSQIHYERFD